MTENEGTKFTFGKHINKPVVEVMAQDPQYCEWAMQQPWFKEKYPTIYQQINNVVVMTNSPQRDNSPVHNEMQLNFMDVDCILDVLKYAGVETEYCAGIDTVFEIPFTTRDRWERIVKYLDVYVSYPYAVLDVREVELRYEDHQKYLHEIDMLSEVVKEEQSMSKILKMGRHCLNELYGKGKEAYKGNQNYGKKRSYELFRDLNYKRLTKEQYKSHKPGYIFDNFKDRINGIYISLKPTIGDDFFDIAREFEEYKSLSLSVPSDHSWPKKRLLIFQEYTGTSDIEKVKKLMKSKGWIMVKDTEIWKWKK